MTPTNHNSPAHQYVSRAEFENLRRDMEGLGLRTFYFERLCLRFMRAFDFFASTIGEDKLAHAYQVALSEEKGDLLGTLRSQLASLMQMTCPDCVRQHKVVQSNRAAKAHAEATSMSSEESLQKYRETISEEMRAQNLDLTTDFCDSEYPVYRCLSDEDMWGNVASDLIGK